MTDDRALGEAERLHPLFLLTGLSGALKGMAGGYAAIAYLAVSGRWTAAAFATAALLVALVVGLALYWHRFSFRIGPNEIRIDSGILSRTHRSIPFDRVQDVDISQGPVARLLGLARVKFETGASAGGDKEEGVLQAIALDRAEALRALVRERRPQSAAAARAAKDDVSERPVYAMTAPRLLLAGAFNFSLALFAGLFGITQTIGEVIGFDPLSRAFWSSILTASGPLTSFILANRIAAAAAGIILLLLVGIGTGIVRTTLRDYGFRLDQSGSGLRRRRGLLTLTDVTVPVRRAQAAILASGPVREAFGWSELRLQSLARDEQGKGDHVLAPLADPGEANHILERLGWRALPDGPDWSPVSSAYVWTFALALSPLFAVALVQLAVNAWLGLASLAILVTLLAVRYLAWTRTRYLLDGDRLLVGSGWWRRRTIVLPLERIQSADVAHDFVSRIFKVARLRLGVAGGSGFSAHEIPALATERASALRASLLSPRP